MDKLDIEKKLGSLEIPPHDEAKKELTIQAAMKEFEESGKELSEKSKGIENERRQRGKKGRFFPIKGGPLMTRPMFATISLMFVAILLGYSLIYYPGVTGHDDYAGLHVYSEESENLIAKIAGADSKSTAINNRRKSKSRGALSKPEKRLGVSKDSPGTRRVDEKFSNEDVFKPMIFSSNDEVVQEEVAPAAPMISAMKAEPMKVERKAKADTRGREQDGLFLSDVAAPSPTLAKKQVSGYVGGVVVLHEAETNVIGNEYAGRDQFESLKENSIKLTSETPVSTFSLDVDTASYSFVRRSLNQGHLPQKDAVRIEELINYFDYDYTVPKSKSEPFKPTVALYPTPWNKKTMLMHIGIKGHDIVKSERPRANLVFLLDVSGSMGSPDKLPLLKNSMKMLVNELSPEDTVAIAVYAGAAGTVLEPTKVSEKGKILAALDRLNSGGSTAGGAGIKLAYSLAEANFDKEAVNRVILATDGDFNVGIQNTNELKGFIERKRKTGVFLSVLGFGQGNYNDQLMQALAQNGNGNAAYIDTLSEARKVLVEESSSTLFTIAKDVKIQVEFNPLMVSEYRLIGYESRILNREDFNNDKVDAGEVGAGTSVTAIYEITPAGSESSMMDPLRYAKESKSSRIDKKAEYAFLKIRYKLPDEDKSRLITTPINRGLAYEGIISVPTDVRFAASVAAFGQLLKGSKYIKDFSYDDVRKLAEDSRGRDRFGYRSEFLKLIGLAETASTMGDR